MNIYDHLRRLRKMVEPIGREREAEAQRQAALLRDYRTAFGGQAGRRVLLDLIARTGVMQTTHTPGDPLATAFAEGRRRIGLEILQMLQSDPDGPLRLAETGEIDDLLATTRTP